MNHKPRLYLDLDGVFVDLDHKMKELYSNRYQDQLPDEVWSKLTHTVPNFFFHMKPMHDYERLLSAIKPLEDRYEIGFLSATPRPTGYLITASDDKHKWVRKYLHDYWLVHTVPGWENKKKYITSSKDILIDDSKRNIDDWTNHGGIGIHHVSVDQTIDSLMLI